MKNWIHIHVQDFNPAKVSENTTQNICNKIKIKTMIW